ncbi:MAG: hypothetical protein RL021_1153 [Bacteroidota bacterium]|jgi:hypothetical protein
MTFARKFNRLFNLSFFIPLLVSAQVSVVKQENGFILMRNGAPYYIKGVGGTVNMEFARSIGANSIRTWGIERAGEILDEAHKNGLTVMLGLWLQHERHGFDYDDSAAVQNQFNHFKSVIDTYKDHPALLLWGVGNEVDLNYTNPNVWYAVQQIARYIHETDPRHPTSTVTAGLDSMEVAYIRDRAPDIDIYGVNTYGDIAHVPADISRYGWNGPYMITEWGTNGYWESPLTPWKVSIEPTSTQKKTDYVERYRRYIEPFPACLGSYAFLWGAKQEYTETWFGLFSKDNLPTEPVDALEYVFTGNHPAYPSPAIRSFELDRKVAGDGIRLKAGNRYEASVLSSFPAVANTSDTLSNEVLTYDWKVLAESEDKKSGGDREAEASRQHIRFRNKHSPLVSFVAPDSPGSYRLFVNVYGHGKVAYANIPFQVIPRSAEDGPARPVSFKHQKMEFIR